MGKSRKKPTRILRDGVDAVARQLKRGQDAIWESAQKRLDKAYLAKRPAAQKNLDRVKGKNPGAKPIEIQGILETELKEKEQATSYEAFVGDATTFILTNVELAKEDLTKNTKLRYVIYLFLVLDSALARGLSKLGGIALGILFDAIVKKLMGVVNKKLPANTSKKLGGKIARAVVLGLLTQLFDIKGVGAGSLSAAVVFITRKNLSPLPADWS
jgi:hypothetical protein